MQAQLHKMGTNRPKMKSTASEGGRGQPWVGRWGQGSGRPTWGVKSQLLLQGKSEKRKCCALP